MGIFDGALKGFQLSSLGGRTFHEPGNISIYFRSQNMVGFGENQECVAVAPQYLSRRQRHRHCGRSVTDQTMTNSEDVVQSLKSKAQTKNVQTSSPVPENSGQQLFHISSLTTRFGETYRYVANHINSQFSLVSARVQKQETFKTQWKHGKRKSQNISDLSHVKLNNVSSSWEEGYLLFARHINNYFGAKATYEAQKKGDKNLKEIKSYEKQLFTSSNSHNISNPNNFGENNLQTEETKKQFFNSQGQLKNNSRGSFQEVDQRNLKAAGRLKYLSIAEYLRYPTASIPNLLSTFLKTDISSQTIKPKTAVTSPKSTLKKSLVLGHRQAEETTWQLITSLRLAPSMEALTASLEALNQHLILFPSCKGFIWQEKATVTLLRHRRTYKQDERLQAALRETCALIGLVDPLQSYGIRVLSIDGGGTRGVIPLEVLKMLEDKTGKKIHQLFDYICGVSTGAILAFMLGLARFSLEECADMYREISTKVFQQNRLVGTVKMGWSHSYYNTETWENILKKELGNRVLINTSRDQQSPKVSAVSAVVNWGASPKAFVFRNYNHKPGSLSRYTGSSGHQMWQAVRASSAAPGYFQEFTLESNIHQDGGILMNNPCALAVHESRLLWPKHPFQCVLSLGTGRYDNTKRMPATSTSLKAKITNFISSATNTEGVHTLLDDLLAPNVYFRFNPMLSAEVALDENRPGALEQLQRDTQYYLERNQLKAAKLCLVLGRERSSAERAVCWMKEKSWEVRHRLM
ncbi:calcium-independent phospholipase A2-gamma isoform X1 [Oryzias latipes]|uniref:calcium-independent phospholipase A2-gamma isoform X1 n=2 Tax=Oryzias latipes TaxID=8090 RepID=UPI0005CC3D09|nr:calcium-independent phospholipase A2-gamma isoform X1 [Oryzias latipes]